MMPCVMVNGSIVGTWSYSPFRAMWNNFKPNQGDITVSIGELNETNQTQLQNELKFLKQLINAGTEESEDSN